MILYEKVNSHGVDTPHAVKSMLSKGMSHNLHVEWIEWDLASKFHLDSVINLQGNLILLIKYHLKFGLRSQLKQTFQNFNFQSKPFTY